MENTYEESQESRPSSCAVEPNFKVSNEKGYVLWLQKLELL